MLRLESILSDQEIRQESLLGLGATWHCNGINVPPVKAGHLLLLDALQSPYANYKHDITMFRIQEAIAVFAKGQDVIQPVFEYISGASSKWEKLPGSIADTVNADNADAVDEQIEAQIEYSFGGFEMIQGEGEAVTDHFDMVWIGNIAQVSGYSVDEILWRYPLVLIGHIVAAEARAGGAVVERPKDIEKAFEDMMKWRKEERN